jgi:DNA-binding beta-propeller fold protein YncE
MRRAGAVRGLAVSASVLAAITGALLGWPVADASAAVGHKFAKSITEAEPFEPFVSPLGVAADASGNVFVADPEGHALDVFDSTNKFIAHVGAGELSSGFDRGVAVSDATGEVFVANSEPDELQAFKPNVPGEPAKGYASLSPWTGATTAENPETSEKSFGGSCCFTYVAVNNSKDEHAGDAYVLNSQVTGTKNLFVVKPGASGEEAETVEELFVAGAGEEDGLAVSPLTGEVYVASPGTGVVDVFNVEGVEQPSLEPKGSQVPVIGSLGKPVDVAVDPTSGNVYVVDATNHVIDEFNPAGQFVAQITQTEAEPGKPEALVNPLAVTVSSAGEVYVSDAGTKAVDVFGPDEEAPLAPTVTQAVVSGLSATEATLQASIDPNGLAPGFDTTYHFEYGTSTAYGTRGPDAKVEAGTGAVPVSMHLLGLGATTTYHWRLLATNEHGTTSSLDHTFIYDQAVGGLPDHRSYEMVSPPQKDGALIGSITFGPPPAVAEGGSRVILGSIQCFADAESCPVIRGTHVGTPYAFTRTGGGWVASALAPPATQFATDTWWTYSPDAGTALFSAPSAPHGEDDLYARRSDGSFLDVGPLSPPAAGPNLAAVTQDPGLAATADLSHVLYATEPVWPFSQNGFAAKEGSLFEYTPASSKEPALVGVSGPNGSADLISACKTALAALPAEGELSADGRVVYFISGIGPTGPCPSGTGANNGTEVPVEELYARVDSGEPDAATVPISQPMAPQTLALAAHDEACTKAECQEDITQEANWRDAQFWRASSDGSKVFFTSSQRLTDEASEDPSPADTKEGCPKSVAGKSGCNLYEYEGAAAKDASGSHLIDVSAGDHSGGGPRVQGVLAASNDGSHVYFVAKGVLTAAANDLGQSARQEQDNLYVYERDPAHPAGQVAFIAVLSASDRADWEVDSEPNVTPDGRFLVFTSSGALTPDVTRGDGARQLYRYDDQTGQLLRVSIGERGFNDNGNGGSGDATIVGGYHGYARAGVGRSDPTMSHDGAYIFFMSPVALTREALSSVHIGTCTVALFCTVGQPLLAENIYEYHEGTVSLISDGRDTAVEHEQGVCGGSFSATCLIGVDATGKNVFFSTADQLSPQDTDTQLDVYDARICEPEHGDPCIQPPSSEQSPCIGESCHGTPPAALSQLTPGSASFSGAGNLPPPAPSIKKPLTKAQKLAKALKACRKDKQKAKRVSCERQARKKYGPAKVKKSGAKGRAK